jgi:tetratricopeptide (TPR) repeat protein
MNKHIALLCSIFLLLAGCSSMHEQDTAIGSSPKTEETDNPPVLASFEPETLYALLVAEIAGHRQRYDVTLTNYLHQAEKTRDPGIAERAAQIAVYLKSNKAALHAARIWHEAAPGNLQAKHTLAVELIKANRFMEAMTLLEEVLNADKTASFDFLAANTSTISLNKRNEILAHYNHLLKLHPKNTRLLAGKVVLLDLNGRKDEALKTAVTLYRLDSSTQNLLVKAKLEHQLGNSNSAIDSLVEALDQEPENTKVRLLYAQILIDTKSLPEAQNQFALLAKQSPDNHQMYLTFALLAMENGKFVEARAAFQALTQVPSHRSDAHYYLGQLADLENKPDLALGHYQQVDQGSKLIPSYMRIGEMLVEQHQLTEFQTLFEQARADHPAEKKDLYMFEASLLTRNGQIDLALSLLNAALEEFKDDIALLYSRAMTAEKNNDLALMEQDFIKILSVEPDNAMVLNALGYTLADRTTRYEEALRLIMRAKELKPDDPAITDSLGWAHFRLGNLSQSIKLLTEALQKFPDQEVAAHLGEVLWVNGEKDKAREVWRRGLKFKPENPSLKRVIKRLNPELLK